MAGIDVGLIITALNNAGSTLQGTADDVKKIGDNAEATSNRLKAIQVVLAGIAIEKTRELAEAFLQASAGAQLLDTRLAAFTGSAASATELQRKLNDEFGATPLKIDTLTQSWIKLQTVTGNAGESTRIIEAIANAVTAMGGGDAQIQNLTQSFQRMLATGNVQGRQFNAMITDAGLSIGDLAKAAGVSTQKLQSDIQNGFVGAKALVDDFVKASNARFGDFGKDLGATLAGAMQKVTNDFNMALEELGSRTNINDRLVLIFHNISDEITRFIGSIDQQKVDDFFHFLQAMEPTVASLVKLIADLAAIVAKLTLQLAEFVGALPEGSRELGIVGFVLFGVKGAVVGAILGEVFTTLQGWYKDTEAFLSRIHIISDTETPQQKLSGMLNGGTPQLRGGEGEPASAPKSIFDASQSQLDALAQQRANLADHSKAAMPTDDFSLKLQNAIEAAQRWGDTFGLTMQKIGDDFSKMSATVSGDELGAKVEGINKQFDGWNSALEAAIIKESALKVHTAANALLIEMAREKEAEVNKLRDEAIAKEQTLFAIKTQSFALAQQSARIGLQQQLQTGQIQSNTSSGFNLVAGTPGGQLELQVMAQRLSLQKQIIDATKSEKDIDAQIVELGGPGGPQADKVAELEKTKDAYGDLIKMSHQALSSLSADALAQKQLWQDLGNTLNTDVADGIKGLIQGTMTWSQIATKVWGDVTDLVIKYLLKLAEAQIMQQALNSSGGLGGGGFSIGSLLGGLFENGAAFNGHVKMFANGDVVTGPTMFGIAGEAGPEAIMPLTRIGGQLGVRSQGGSGGNQYNITVQAVDTQTGMEFIGKHIDTIDQNLQHRQRLHRAGRGGI